MNFKTKLAVVVIALLACTTNGCRKDFDEINTNPFNPTQTSMEALFNGVLSSWPLSWNEQFYVNNETLYDLTEQGALIARAWPNIRIGVDEIWDNYYATLRNIRALEARFDQYETTAASPDELDNVRAQLKIILAYKTLKVTDLFGDMPFSDAGRGSEAAEFLRPKYDSQQSIYAQLLTDLEWAAAHIHLEANGPSGQPFYRFRQFDTVLKDDLTLWRRLANSLRLRAALRISEKDPALSAQIVEDVLKNNLPLVQDGKEICLWPRDMGVQFDSHQWSFAEHKNLRMGTTMWHLMATHDSTDGSGIIDPRAFVFFETNNLMQWRAFPNEVGTNPPLEGGIPYNGGRDFNYDSKGSACRFSPFNYYLIRDQNDVPEILMTAAEVHFLKAEAYKRGIGVAENDFSADAEYADGIRASIKFWYSVVAKTARWENKPEEPTEGQIFKYIYDPSVSFSGNGFKLELIYAQRWIDQFRQPWEAFALARQTGKTPREATTPLTYNRFPYPASESEYNQANWQAQVSKMGGADVKETPVWWMKN